MRIKKMEVLAGISDILYHSTSINKLQDILKDNRIHMTSNLGTNADKLYKRAKFRPYFFSLSRVKYGGFAQTIGHEWIVTLVIDGTKLKEKYYGQSVDYWGEDWRKTADENAKKTGDKSTRTKYDENEDRIYSDQPFIDPLSKYVTEIHVMLSDLCVRNLHKEELTQPEWETRYNSMRRYDEVGKYAQAMRIPIFFYDDFGAFKLMNKHKSVKAYKRSSGNYIQDMNALFEIPAGTDIDEFSKDARKVVFRVIYSGDWRDFKSALECDFHNNKSGDRSVKLDTDEFIRNMKKNRLKDLDAVQKFFEAKFSYLK